MKKWDYIGHELAKMQANIFEQSFVEFNGSSPVFIRLFMNSEIVKHFDDSSFLIMSTGISYRDLLLPTSNGVLRGSGKTRYSQDELHWMGYIYRYWAYTRELSSVEVYHRCPGSKLVNFYSAMHTQDPEAALDTIEESCGVEKEINLNQKLLAMYKAQGGTSPQSK